MYGLLLVAGRIDVVSVNAAMGQKGVVACMRSGSRFTGR